MFGNLNEVTKFLNQDYNRAYRLYRSGMLPTKRIGGQLLVDVEKARRVLDLHGKQVKEQSESLPVQPGKQVQ